MDKTIEYFDGIETNKLSFEQFVTDKLDETIFGSGEIETIKGNVENLNKFIARLLSLLYDKGILSEYEILELLNYYMDDDETIKIEYKNQNK